ncbi:MAG: spore-cortex-lytic enzyme prepeptide [Devosia sp.]|nr:spore-cortex-lytic enzyme prepeptide [Devosia sp.]
MAGIKPMPGLVPQRATAAIDAELAAPLAATSSERDCLMRAMYFESNRGSDDGLFAVGTVVMNRVADPKYPKSICTVVGQPNQFATGIMSNPMNEDASVQRIAAIADRLLAGERHPAVGTAKFFHQAGLTFGYSNMHYVLEAGGNAFYERH